MPIWEGLKNELDGKEMKGVTLSLIEVDCDFYHCNPKLYNNGPVCKTQEINIKNDKLKNEWAQSNGYKLLRFWENDINNNIKQVKQILLENLK